MNDAFLSSCFSLLTLTQTTILKRLQSARSFFHAMRRRKLIDGMKLSAHEEWAERKKEKPSIQSTRGAWMLPTDTN